MKPKRQEPNADKTDRECEAPASTGHRVFNESPAARWVNQLLLRAIRERASDIHLEPTSKGLTVQLRVDGALRTVTTVGPDLAAGIISRLKAMARMNVAEERKAQDGRYRAIADGREVNFQISSFPMHNGESIVVRVLDRENE